MSRTRADSYRERIATAFLLHPKVALQDLVGSEEERRRLADAVPDLVPFKDHSYHAFIPVVDWDHRLPSEHLVLRIYAYYTNESYRYGQADLKVRLEEIRRRNVFPEFDVPDLSGLVADEAYDVLTDLQGQRQSARLASSWRRDLEPREAARAATVVRASQEFRELARKYPKRPRNLGDAEAVSWVPPCETNHSSWTVDVWYLVSYDGMFGKGHSFLVDLKEERVVAVREFTVRPD